MLNEIINYKIQTIHLETKISEAISICNKFHINFVPIVVENQLLGMISLENLQNHLLFETIDKLKFFFESFFILESVSLVDSIKYFNTFSSNVVPIVSTDNKYLGLICIDDILSKFVSFPFFNEFGLVLLLEIQTKKYAVSEIAKIVESNNCKLFGTLLVEYNSLNVRVLVKLDTHDSQSVISSFERFGYVIVGKYFTEHHEDWLKNRYEHLMKILET